MKGKICRICKKKIRWFQKAVTKYIVSQGRTSGHYKSYHNSCYIDYWNNTSSEKRFAELVGVKI